MSQRIEVANLPEPVKLANGTPIPPIGYGVYLVDPNDGARAVYDALVTGYRLIDSAVFYKNEKAAGEGISKFLNDYPNVKRSDVFYTTKVPGAEFSYNNALKTIHESLDRVKELQYIDLVLIHFPSGTPETRLDTYQALVDAQKDGLVKEIGVSNYGVHHLQEILDAGLPAPAVNQIEINPWLHRKDIVDFCHKHHIAVEAYSPLTRGHRVSDDKQLATLSKKYNKTPSQILLRWSVEYGMIPLPKTTHTERMIENLSVFDFQLSTEDFHSFVDENYISNPEWDPCSWPLVHRTK